ncbi:MAG: bis(5'-nucleosyl)-tetraphosphatase (symmetrical) YqeK [Oscillospiraceae bacterium]|nr:bis(5'-nucleosyl)-tetraphosphatase (symmetrical) YqeK [Oscillospiraceae bacterium]
MYSVDEFKNILSLKLSKKRYTHSLNVADEARKLAEHYGYHDPGKAYLAGLLHDVCKEIPSESQLEMVMKSDRSVTEAEIKSPPLHHAIAGAYYAETVFGFSDEDFLNSIRYHTVGRGDMSRLEEIVYLADLVSAERSYKDVDKMRKVCYQSIDKAMLEALVFSIESVIKKGTLIPLHTIDAYNRYRLILKKD